MFLRHLCFCPGFCDHIWKRLDYKTKVNFKIYDSTDWIIHLLSNISISKDNQTTKFGELIEYNMINIFLEKSYPKYIKLKCWPLVLKAFLKNKKRSRSSLPPSFSRWFWRKIFFILYFINWPNFPKFPQSMTSFWCFYC